jgi:hypothetical protein
MDPSDDANGTVGSRPVNDQPRSEGSPSRNTGRVRHRTLWLHLRDPGHIATSCEGRKADARDLADGPLPKSTVSRVGLMVLRT